MRRILTLFLCALILGSTALAQSAKSKASEGNSLRGKCKYSRLWLDPEADGSPQGRTFIKKVGDLIRTDGRVELAKSRKNAQAMFGQVVTSTEAAPSQNMAIDCTNSGSGTDCYSANFHAHAGNTGAYEEYTGPVSKTYGWTFLDTRTLLGLFPPGGVPVNFKRPKATAQAILAGLGCSARSPQTAAPSPHKGNHP